MLSELAFKTLITFDEETLRAHYNDPRLSKVI